jgi:hypothetical protein
MVIQTARKMVTETQRKKSLIMTNGKVGMKIAVSRGILTHG